MSLLSSNISLGNDSGLTAMEIEFLSDTEYHVKMISVKQKKNTVDFKELYNDKTDKEKLTELIKGKVIILLLTGKGILTKKIIFKNEEIQLEDIIHNSSKEVFYFQTFPIGNVCFASVCRKQTVDEVFTLFKTNKAIIAETYLGLGVCRSAYEIIGNEEIRLPAQTLFFREQQLIEIKSQENEKCNYKAGTKEISSELIPSLCAAISFMNDVEKTSSIESEDYTYFKNEYKQRNYFQKAGAVILVSFLFILFGNYLAYNHYSERYQLLEEEVAYKKSEIDLLGTLTNELKEKQKIIGGTGLNNGYKLSLIADRLGQTVPSTVKLTEMNIQPLVKGKLKNNEKAEFVTDKVILKGKIFKSTDINDWVKEIKNDKTVKEVVVSNYNQSLNDNFAEFELMIQLN